MPWPSGTRGGAASPWWGGYVRLWVRAALGAGRTFHMGPHAQDRLDAGNVLAGGPIIPGADGTLWVDLSCDVLDVTVSGGASASEGVFTKPDAATCEVTLADPDRDYDPLNTESPWAIGGHSRLTPGVRVDVFVEIVNGSDGTWTRRWLFTGTADSWEEDWSTRAQSRQCKLTATDGVKLFANFHRPALGAPVGDGDTTQGRVHRVATEVGFTGTIEDGAGVSTHSGTDFSSDGWEEINHSLDGELGYVHFTGDGHLRWVGRDAYFDTTSPPVLALGCAPEMFDVLVDASPSPIDRQMRNAVYGQRPGGVLQQALSTASISRYGRYDFTRTDLDLASDGQVATWVQIVLQQYAYPQVSLNDVTSRPAIAPQSWDCWRQVLAVRMVSDLVRIYWVPPDRPDDAPIDTNARVVGVQHTITRHAWEVRWQLVDASALLYSGLLFTMGPHANDRLDAGFVLG